MPLQSLHVLLLSSLSGAPPMRGPLKKSAELEVWGKTRRGKNLTLSFDHIGNKIK